jgi:hypothetical protein
MLARRALDAMLCSRPAAALVVLERQVLLEVGNRGLALHLPVVVHMVHELRKLDCSTCAICVGRATRDVLWHAFSPFAELWPSDYVQRISSFVAPPETRTSFVAAKWPRRVWKNPHGLPDRKPIVAGAHKLKPKPKLKSLLRYGGYNLTFREASRRRTGGRENLAAEAQFDA